MSTQTTGESISLASLTSLGVGGHAGRFVCVTDRASLQAEVRQARAQNSRIYLLGGGSNLVVADEGVNGTVVQVAIKGQTILEETAEGIRIRVNAGEVWDDFVAHAVNNQWAGVECMSGIPGWVGAAPIQNIGAYGQEVASVIEQVEVLDLNTGRFENYSNSECQFSYRSSAFKKNKATPKAVVSVTFKLKKKNEGLVQYRDLQADFASSGQAPELQHVRDAVLRIRGNKSMLLEDKDPNGQSAGSFFTNPILDEEGRTQLLQKTEGAPPIYPYGDRYKTSAAWLIEQAGFEKGFALGAAALSSKHTLAITNQGNASSAEIVHLAKVIQAKVWDRWQILLIPEPQFWGFDPHPLMEQAP
tara:strand:+ start:534 stop:1610 length:1077 start_codon:yes stop_codon:yes gene_type:complete